MSDDMEKLPRPASELEALASYYDEHDTADEMEDGRWVQPMVTTSLRLPGELVEQIKENARREGKRHTAYIRELLEHSMRGSAAPGELTRINRKLDVLLEAVQPAKDAKARRSTTKKSASTGKRVKRAAPTKTSVKRTA